MSKDIKLVSSRRTFMKAAVATGAYTYFAPMAFGKRLPSGPVLNMKNIPTATHWGSVKTDVRGGNL